MIVCMPALLHTGSCIGLTFWRCAALLQRVMSLTPQQIELLPPQQKAQVLALQQQMVSNPAVHAIILGLQLC